ncbi:MAG: Rieske 2Fe-2S domain-containing protein [Armatimonadetes bacterium]|nr:Rieske 2Fe-2S domain-containing protein [Armatimonadota bacterium]
MLSVKENERLTRVGPGTPMGELMRRYWQPVACTVELKENPTKAVRILCENLVLYKDRSGRLGLIQEACPHRRVNLLYGIPEEHGLRCPYHGWLFDETGRCLEQPAEARKKRKVNPKDAASGRFVSPKRVGAEPGNQRRTIHGARKATTVRGAVQYQDQFNRKGRERTAKLWKERGYDPQSPRRRTLATLESCILRTEAQMGPDYKPANRDQTLKDLTRTYYQLIQQRDALLAELETLYRPIPAPPPPISGPFVIHLDSKNCEDDHAVIFCGDPEIAKRVARKADLETAARFLKAAGVDEGDTAAAFWAGHRRGMEKGRAIEAHRHSDIDAERGRSATWSELRGVPLPEVTRHDESVPPVDAPTPIGPALPFPTERLSSALVSNLSAHDPTDGGKVPPWER